LLVEAARLNGEGACHGLYCSLAQRAASVEHLLGHMHPLLAREGWLVVFDRKPDRSWSRKISRETEALPTGEIIHVLSC
jgi:hypothetical protein